VAGGTYILLTQVGLVFSQTRVERRGGGSGRNEVLCVTFASLRSFDQLLIVLCVVTRQQRLTNSGTSRFNEVIHSKQGEAEHQ
jgi:hypothetical protein